MVEALPYWLKLERESGHGDCLEHGVAALVSGREIALHTDRPPLSIP
jgi:hypothetical protein